MIEFEICRLNGKGITLAGRKSDKLFRLFTFALSSANFY